MKAPHRRSVRITGYDYAQSGAYFITICTEQKQHLFGQISNDGPMCLNATGKIVENEWLRTPSLRKNVVLDEHIVMPNHVHGIIFLQNGADSNQQGEHGRGVLHPPAVHSAADADQSAEHGRGVLHPPGAQHAGIPQQPFLPPSTRSEQLSAASRVPPPGKSANP